MTKQDLIQRIQALPEDAPFDQLAVEIEKFRFKARVDRGLRQAERGETVPHEEIEKMIDGWLAE
jgi:predicted transcriptional regulator